VEVTNVRPGRNRLHVLLTRARRPAAGLALARARRRAPCSPLPVPVAGRRGSLGRGGCRL